MFLDNRFHQVSTCCRRVAVIDTKPA